MSVSNTGNGLVTITQMIFGLLVGDNTSNQIVDYTGGTNYYLNISVGINASDTNNSLTVANDGTVLFANANSVIGESGPANSLSISSGGSLLNNSSGVVGLNASASGNHVLVTGG